MKGRFPRSPYDREGDILFFPRMLDKIRLFQRGELPAEYHENFGRGFDGGLCSFLGVNHKDVVTRVAEGGSDAEILEWCMEHGRRPADGDIFLWNEFLRKCGWKDRFAERLRTRLEGLGMEGRTDVQTMLDLIEVDEGRPPRDAGA